MEPAREPWAELETAIERGDAPVAAVALARLREAGWAPDRAGELLHRAVLGSAPGTLAVAELLVRNGVPLDARGPEGTTPLHHAIASGHDAAAAWLVDRGAPVNVEDGAGNTPLVCAMTAPGPREPARAALLARLLSLGRPLDERDAEGRTLLHLAVLHQSPAVIELLLAAGLDVSATDRQGATPLHALASRPAIAAEAPAAILDLLLARGAVLEARDASGATPLHYATQRDGTILATLLLDRGANVEARTNDGQTPLMTAGDHEDIIALLCARGANPRASGEDGRSALHVAAAEGQHELVGRLLAAGADVRAQDREGRTPLHLAAGADDGGRTAQALMSAGADVRARAGAGVTPLHVAAAAGADVLAAQFLAAGAEVSPRTTAEWRWREGSDPFPAGVTPLDVAELQQERGGGEGHRRILEQLRARGATRSAGFLGRVRRFLGGA